jgi:hypothetical protein
MIDGAPHVSHVHHVNKYSLRDLQTMFLVYSKKAPKAHDS